MSGQAELLARDPDVLAIEVADRLHGIEADLRMALAGGKLDSVAARLERALHDVSLLRRLQVIHTAAVRDEVARVEGILDAGSLPDDFLPPGELVTHGRALIHGR